MNSSTKTLPLPLVLNDLKKPPDRVFYRGDTNLLNLPKISIVGSRRATQYTKIITAKIAQELSKRGVVIVSGAALGVDAVAHKNTLDFKTIAVMANGLDIRYPSTNRDMIEEIEKRGLVLSSYEDGTIAKKYNFVLRNEIVVALGEVLIIAEADKNSGSMRSAEYALRLNKEIFVLPHRLTDSEGTNQLIRDGLAKPIYDIEAFCDRFGKIENQKVETDEILDFCKSNPFFDEALNLFGSKIYEYELGGFIKVENGRIYLI
jgi:DNA processing protein